MVFIYVLQLKENKWYIGKTETSKFRIDTHFDSAGSEFTKKYPPQEIYQIIPECDKYDEDKYVKKYMDKYGIDNVRGGTYCRLELTNNEKEVIQKELWGANDLCFLCGGDHFVKDCPNNKEVEELEINEEYIIDDKLLKTIKQDRITNTNFNSAGHSGHKAEYSKYYIDPKNDCIKLRPNNSDDTYKRIYFDEYFSFDSITVSEYINNDKSIMNLYKKYVSIFINNLTIKNNKYDLTPESYQSFDKIKADQILHNLKDKIKKFIKDLCYLKINKIIETEFHKDYILSNFNLNIDFKEDFCATIYFDYYIEDTLKKKFELGPFRWETYLLRSKNGFKCVQEIASIHTTGELFYK